MKRISGTVVLNNKEFMWGLKHRKYADDIINKYEVLFSTGAYFPLILLRTFPAVLADCPRKNVSFFIKLDLRPIFSFCYKSGFIKMILVSNKNIKGFFSTDNNSAAISGARSCCNSFLYYNSNNEVDHKAGRIINYFEGNRETRVFREGKKFKNVRSNTPVYGNHKSDVYHIHMENESKAIENILKLFSGFKTKISEKDNIINNHTKSSGGFKLFTDRNSFRSNEACNQVKTEGHFKTISGYIENLSRTRLLTMTDESIGNRLLQLYRSVFKYCFFKNQNPKGYKSTESIPGELKDFYYVKIDGLAYKFAKSIREFGLSSISNMPVKNDTHLSAFLEDIKLQTIANMLHTVAKHRICGSLGGMNNGTKFFGKIFEKTSFLKIAVFYKGIENILNLKSGYFCSRYENHTSIFKNDAINAKGTKVSHYSNPPLKKNQSMNNIKNIKEFFSCFYLFKFINSKRKFISNGGTAVNLISISKTDKVATLQNQRPGLYHEETLKQKLIDVDFSQVMGSRPNIVLAKTGSNNKTLYKEGNMADNRSDTGNVQNVGYSLNSFDMKNIVNKVYSEIEQKIKRERERRGI